MTPITLYTIPAQTGEVARFVVTVGTAAEWYREGVTGNLTGDATVVTGLTINRVRLESNDIILNRAGAVGFTDHFSGSGAGVDAQFRFAYDDGSGVEIQTVSLPAALDGAGGGFLRLMPSANVYSAIAGRTVGDLVNVVISNFRGVVTPPPPRPPPPPGGTKVAWLLKITENNGTVRRWWSGVGNLNYDGQTWERGTPIINVGPSEATRGLPNGRTAITINAAAAKNVRVAMLKDIGPAPAEVHRIKDLRQGAGWVDMGHSTIGTLSDPQLVGGLVAFTIETRRGLVLKIAKMWDHASQKRRDKFDDFFEYKAKLAGEGISDSGFPPRRD